MSQRWACIIGQPVAHSLSPALHNAAFAACGVDAAYEAREVAPDGVGQAVAALREPSCLGANVTAPHKAAVVPFLDRLSDEARLLGVVNTIVNADGRLVGDNTDARGLERWMRLAGVDVVNGEALVLGAGGAARSSVVALARMGARSIRVLNRTPERAERLVADLALAGLSAAPLAYAAEPATHPVRVVVNATSLGHQDAAPVVHPSWYSPATVAVELVYNPRSTRFMHDARSAGARAENGLGMLIHQAMLSFELWTGQAAPEAVYAAAADRALGAHA